jgi:hypothetical protein
MYVPDGEVAGAVMLLRCKTGGVVSTNGVTVSAKETVAEWFPAGSYA